MVIDEEVREKLTEAAKTGIGQPEDVFASMHQTYLPMVINSLGAFSKKELLRLLTCVLQIPPDEKLTRKFTDQQRVAFYTIEKILLSKYSMLLKVIMEKTEADLQVEVTKKEAELGTTLTQEQKSELLNELLNKKEEEAREHSLARPNNGQSDGVPSEQSQGTAVSESNNGQSA